VRLVPEIAETQTREPRALRVKVPCGSAKERARERGSRSAQRQLGLSSELEDRPWRSTRAALFSSVLCWTTLQNRYANYNAPVAQVARPEGGTNKVDSAVRRGEQ